MSYDGKANRDISTQERGDSLPIRTTRGEGPQSGGGHQARADGGPETASADIGSTQRPFRLGQDPAGRLTRQILQLLPEAELRLILSDSTSWASATFAGARHLVLLERGADGAFTDCERNTIEALKDHEFDISRHLVADLAAEILIDGERQLLRIEALTVEVG
jgi:hypothetical protein